MIESVEFHNLKALRNTTLPLGRFTLIIGPNGSGKSTALWALQSIGNKYDRLELNKIATAGLPLDNSTTVDVVLRWGKPYEGVRIHWSTGGGRNYWDKDFEHGLSVDLAEPLSCKLNEILSATRIYSFDAQQIAAPTSLEPRMTLGSNGSNLAGVLDRLRDSFPERFETLNAEMGRWLPEFERILFDTPSRGERSFILRTRNGKHKIQASEISQGTLIALAILTLAYIPDPPPIVCLEEPDRGIHPRLLREVRDAMYRLSYPENYGERRDPVQVIATTHSPYFLDLFRDHPEEIVIAGKDGLDVHFERLSDREDLEEILGDVPLGDAWYSGVLGGIPSHT